MVRTRKERKTENEIQYKQPDRSGPTEATLLELAQERNLFDEADRKQGKPRKRKRKVSSEEDEEDEDEEGIPPGVDRVTEAMLWSVSLAMLHFAFDVLVQRQYAMDISWHQIVVRTLQALVGELPTCSLQKQSNHNSNYDMYLTNQLSFKQSSPSSSMSFIPMHLPLS